MEKVTVNPSIGNSIVKLIANGETKTAIVLLLVYAGLITLPYAVDGVERLAHDVMEQGYTIDFSVGACEFKLDKSQPKDGIKKSNSTPQSPSQPKPNSED